MTSGNNGLNRRQVGAGLLSGAMLTATAKTAVAQANPDAEHMAHMPPRPDAGPPVNVGMLVYPGMILLDMAGPQTVLQVLGADIHLVGETMAPVPTDIRIPVTPTTTMADCPRELDVLFVPGGLMGTVACMNNPAVLSFLRDWAEAARYVTGVCTGVLVLAAAGLLRGYKATAHWGVADLLPLMGAIHEPARVVQDRNRLTGAGTTAGLDFGLTLATLLRGQKRAEDVQLILEYAPEPPFHAGSPDEIGPARLAEARSRRVWMDGHARDAAVAAAERLGL